MLKMLKMILLMLMVVFMRMMFESRDYRKIGLNCGEYEVEGIDDNDGDAEDDDGSGYENDDRRRSEEANWIEMLLKGRDSAIRDKLHQLRPRQWLPLGPRKNFKFQKSHLSTKRS